ncbi:MAG TPA: hypothetical protein VHS96_11100 [Bacteroidia bacterium]|jgi:hypothetical protein|nr:hypothetical protein [Bacteroidia bacterium]
MFAFIFFDFNLGFQKMMGQSWRLPAPPPLIALIKKNDCPQGAMHDIGPETLILATIVLAGRCDGYLAIQLSAAAWIWNGDGLDSS